MFQLELYEKLGVNNNLEVINIFIKNDVIDIMISDHVYAEYGLDSECIKAAADKYKVKEDPNFSDILEKINNNRNNSFII